MKLLAVPKSNQTHLFVGEEGTETIEVFNTANPTAESTNFNLPDNSKIYAISGDISDRILLGISNGLTNRVLIHD